jgi:hypothetical protein
VMPVVCRPHSARLIASHRHAMRQTFAAQLLSVARKTLGNL